MARDRSIHVAFGRLICLVVLPALCMYFGYYAYGPVSKGATMRVYDTATIATLFVPAAWGEAQIRGSEMDIVTIDESDGDMNYRLVYSAKPIHALRRP